ncbi:MAG: DUF4190 domain-containing protein [Armatimonadia bacterium]
MEQRICPRCHREQPDTAQGDKCLFCGADLAEPAAAAPPVAPATPPASGLPVVVNPGKRECPNCHEILYDTERRCWRCGREFEPSPKLPEPPPAPPVETMVSAPPAPPAPEPPVTAPPEAAAAPTAPPAVPYVATALPPSQPNEGQTLGTWALVVSLFSFCCPVLASIAAIYLGSKARAKGATSTGTAAVVLGIITLVIGGILGLLLIIGMIFGDQTEQTKPDSSLSPWTPVLVCCARALIRSLT